MPLSFLVPLLHDWPRCSQSCTVADVVNSSDCTHAAQQSHNTLCNALLARATLGKVAADVAAMGSEAIFIPTDCSKADAVEKAVAETVGKWGVLHLAVGCVGGGHAVR